MRLRLIVGIGLLTSLGSVAIIPASRKAQGEPEAQQTDGLQVPVTAQQLQAEKKIIPVELRCGHAQLAKRDTIDRIPCVVRNNTNKNITAMTINSSVVIETGGQTSADSDFLSLVPIAHSDFREERKGYLIAPGEEVPVPSLTTSYDDGLIKGVIVQIDYIEFADGTALGPNRAGSRIIADIRDGAAKYKDWLTEKYNRSGNSANAIRLLLEKDLPLPEEIESLSSHQREGAIIYRNHARKTFETKGAKGLIKHLASDRLP